MRYLIFNIVVIGALAFIFLGDGVVRLPLDLLPDRLSLSSVVGQERAPQDAEITTTKPSNGAALAKKPVASVDRGEDAKATPDPVAEEESSIPAATRKASKPPAETKPVPEIPVSEPPETPTTQEPLPPIGPAVTVATLAPKAAPAPGSPEANGAPAGRPAIAAPGRSEPVFMSPRERRRELDRMIGELENFFLETVTR